MVILQTIKQGANKELWLVEVFKNGQCVFHRVVKIDQLESVLKDAAQLINSLSELDQKEESDHERT